MNLFFYLKSVSVLSCLAFIVACNDGDMSSQQSTSKPLPKLNNTGITWRGLIPKGTDEECTPVKPFAQQDCDTSNKALPNAGFHYMKVDTNGNELPSNSKDWNCVVDEVSGFMWEVKSDSEGLHNSNDKFTWYNSNKKTNGGKIGDWNNLGNHCYGYQEGKPKTYCHTEQFVSRVNKKGLCGFNDWRLPTRTELTTLINFGRIRPTINTQFFPHAQSDFYWTNSPTTTRILEAWTISFEYGFTTPMRRTDTRYARLVRTANAATSSQDKTQ